MRPALAIGVCILASINFAIWQQGWQAGFAMLAFLMAITATIHGAKQ